ncbi:Fc.00g077810.m01.CDS01 [Cosmosporella sp. VM-42]
MSGDDQPQVAATRPPGSDESPRERILQYDPDSDREPLKSTEVRDIVRLFQCRICSFPLREPVSLPCGRSLCRQCIPESHVRTNITYPASPERLQGFQCPFIECGKEHAVRDCGVDVILNKAVEYIRQEVERGRTDASNSELSTYIVTQDAWAIAGVASLRDDGENRSHAVKGGKLVATYWLAEEGYLQYEAEVTYQDSSTASGGEPIMFNDMSVLKRAQENIRPEMECQVCYALFYDPLTTACGHTFCRSCLHRILDHSRYCPICRGSLTINPLLNRTSCPSNETLIKIIETFWLDEVLARKAAVAAETASQLEGFDTAIFVCTLSFPHMPTFLHIFEPRYRLMIRRALEGDRTFGMVLPRRARNHEEAPFHELGTLLRVVNVQYYPDGRCLIETVGLSRFRVLRHGFLDGYTVGKTERIDDVSLEEEEAMEASEASPGREAEPEEVFDDDKSESSERRDSNPMSPSDVDTMSTQKLMEFATSFVARMRDQSVPWLAERMLSIYGECPEDAAIFPWWFASMLPVRDLEKYRLLGTSSVRDRLKICCSWIIEWENSRW